MHAVCAGAHRAVQTKAEEEGNKLEEARQRTQAAEKATEAERKKLMLAQQETAVAKGETEKERTALAAAQKKTETLKKELEEEKQRVDATEKQIVAIKVGHMLQPTATRRGDASLPRGQRRPLPRQQLHRVALGVVVRWSRCDVVRAPAVV